MMPASLPASMESAPSEGPTVRSSTMVSLAGSAPERSWMASVLALSTVKLPEIWPEPPRIGSRMTGADITLSSSTMANGRPTLSLREVAELARARLVEAEGDDRLVGALVEAGLRIDQILARHDRRFLQQVAALAVALGRRIDLVAGRHARLLGLLGRHVRMHLVERQLRRLADQVLELLGILQARELDEDAVGALAHDGRLRRAQALTRRLTVSMAALDGAARRDAAALLGRRQGDRVGAGRRRPSMSLPLVPRMALPIGWISFFSAVDRLLQILGLGDPHLHRVADDAEAGEADLGVAQRLARVVAQRVEPVLLAAPWCPWRAADARRRAGRDRAAAACAAASAASCRPSPSRRNSASRRARPPGRSGRWR